MMGVCHSIEEPFCIPAVTLHIAKGFFTSLHFPSPSSGIDILTYLYCYMHICTFYTVKLYNKSSVTMYMHPTHYNSV